MAEVGKLFLDSNFIHWIFSAKVAVVFFGVGSKPSKIGPRNGLVAFLNGCSCLTFAEMGLFFAIFSPSFPPL